MIIFYILLAVIGGIIATFTGFFQDPSNNFVGMVGMIIFSVGLDGGIIYLWFKMLKIFYPRANIGRLWGLRAIYYGLLL